MFKFNNKHNRIIPLTLLRCFIINFEHISQLFKVSIVDFEQVNVSWVSTPDVLLIFNAHNAFNIYTCNIYMYNYVYLYDIYDIYTYISRTIVRLVIIISYVIVVVWVLENK